jgi:hypothetical protein
MPFDRASPQWSSPVSNRWILTLAFIALAPASAAAQFTTFIAPPNPVKDSIQAVVAAEQKAAADSVTRAQIANMKTWVDSAAGVVVPATDTAFAVQTVTATTETSGGLVAPDTASPVPFLLASGLMGLLIGLYLVRRPRPKAQRLDRP